MGESEDCAPLDRLRETEAGRGQRDNLLFDESEQYVVHCKRGIAQ